MFLTTYQYNSYDDTSDVDVSGNITDKTLSDIRAVATKYDYHEIALNTVSRVVGFMNYKGDYPVRVNVYYTTGTVGTCLNHPIQGKTQLFRRNVSMSMLAEIFNNPRVHTGLGYQQTMNHQQTARTEPCLSEKEEIQLEIKKLTERVEECKEILQDIEKREEEERQRQLQLERERQERLRQAELQRVEEERVQRIEREKQAELERIEEEKQKLQRKREQRGDKFSLYINTTVMEALNSNLDKQVISVALSNGGYIVLYDTGGWSYRGIAPRLSTRLNGRSIHHSSPVFVSLSPTDDQYYFIRFKNGSIWYKGPDSLERAIDEAPCGVHSVSFAPGNSYVIFFTNGSAQWSANLSGVGGYIEETNDRIDFISFAPDSGWVATLKNGSIVESQGLDPGLERAITRQERNGYTVRSVILGPNRQNIIRYSQD